LLVLVRLYGWADAGVRLVVVSDHGEYLGEHGLLRHGVYLWEPNNRVPALFWSSDGARVSFPSPFAAIDTYVLVRDGALPPPSRPEAVGFPDPLIIERSEGKFGNATSAAVWTGGGRKLAWQDGIAVAYDLGSDPHEERPIPLDPIEAVVVESVVARMRAPAPPLSGGEAELQQWLEAIGYATRAP
jgi:hypothetical protein